MFYKKKSYIKAVLFCAVLLMGSYSAASYSDSNQTQAGQRVPDEGKSEDKEVTLDGIKYSRFDLIRDFLNIAFSKTLWNENTGEYFSKSFEYYVRQLAEKPTDKDRAMLVDSDFPHPEWVRAQYAAMDGNYPKFGVINKWNKTEIDVALGWPRSYSSDTESKSPLVGVIADQVQHLAPQIKRVTQIEINFLQPNDPKENGKDYARIRIVFSPMYDNFFKTLPGLSASRFSLGGGKDKASETDLYWGAVTFTPYSRSNVDGYFLPDAENNIDLAVCRVSPFLPEDILKAVTSECLLRALGLSDISKVNQDSLLGNWNREYDAFSKIAAFDRDVQEKIENFESFKPLENLDFKHLEKDYSAYEDFSQYELRLLKMLYCPGIESGMDKYQVIRTLFLNANCNE